MKAKLFRFLALTAAFASAFGAWPAHAARIHVITALTDLADLTRNVGGEHVEVFSLATGIEDTHGVPMKPSFVPKMNQADLVEEPAYPVRQARLRGLLQGDFSRRRAQVH